MVGGAGFALSAPPLDWLPAVFVGLGALRLVEQASPTRRGAALMAFLWATAAGVVGLRFVPTVIDRFTPAGMAGGALALIALSAFQALPWALAVYASRWVTERTRLDARVVFGVAVFAAVSVPMVFSWTPAALLSPWPPLIQLADWIGERGVSLLLALCVAFLVTPLTQPSGSRWSRGSTLAAGAGALGILLMLGHGTWRMRSLASHSNDRPRVTVGVVQGAIPARLRWDPAERPRILARLRRLTVQAEQAGADLVIWPEAAYPYRLPHRAGKGPRGTRSVVGGPVTGPVITGVITRGPEGRYNAATLIDEERTMQLPQAKMALLWFGETVPLGSHLPFLRRLFFRAGGLVPGDQVNLLHRDDLRVGVLNCYEDTLPGIGRRLAGAGANLLVNVTNDAWFAGTLEPELHLRLSVLRAVETRRDLVRAVNLGVPAWIDEVGVIRRRGPVEEPGFELFRPAQNDASPTLYVRTGDAPLWILIATALLASAALRRRELGDRATEPGL